MTPGVEADEAPVMAAVDGSKFGDGCPCGNERPGGTFGVVERTELSRGS